MQLSMMIFLRSLDFVCAASLCSDDVCISVGGMLQRLLGNGCNRMRTPMLLGRCNIFHGLLWVFEC